MSATKSMPPCGICGHPFPAHDHAWELNLPVSQMRCADCPEQICDDGTGR